MNEKDKTGDIISWAIVFILMVAFWPVGLLLLLKKQYQKPRSQTPRSDAAQPQYSQPEAAWPSATQNRRTKAQTKKERTALEKKTGKAVSVILLLISIALFILGANTIAGAARGIWADGLNRWPDFCLGVFYIIGGSISFFSRNIGVKRLAKYKRYHTFISGRGIVPISEIARAAGASIKTVRRDIQAMIDEGYFDRGAYIDNELDSLVLSYEAAEEMRRSAANVSDSQPQAAPGKHENQYMAIMLQLREIKSAIADVSISEKADRIEELTAKIFRIVEEYPEKTPQIRRFLTYYLPTTMKLLRSYATLEKQGIKGENITNTKESIGRVLDTLAVGFEQQLDQLFSSDALDIAADITVLENLMQQDGLARAARENEELRMQNAELGDGGT